MTHATPNTGKRHDTLSPVTGRSGRGTARQTIRIPEDLWEDFGAAIPTPPAPEKKVSRSEVIRAFIEWYVHRPRSKMPKRPTEYEAGGE